MELEELKTAWTSVDERLKKQEVLNTEMVTEILRKKTNKSLKKLKIWDAIGYIVGLPLVIYVWYPLLRNLRFDSTHLILGGILTIIMAIMLAATIGIGVYGFKQLLKIDFANSIKENIRFVNEYWTLQKRANRVIYFATIPFVLLLFVVMVLSNSEDIGTDIGLFLVLIFFILLIFGLPAFLIYKNVYRKNIQTIKKNLEELSELEEE
jgi:hypothetical protein